VPGRLTMRDAADAELIRDLAAIASDATQPKRLRALARAVAIAFRTWKRWSGRVPKGRVALYGRYCGPGHSGPGQPIDAIDAACKRHDAAYKGAP